MKNHRFPALLIATFCLIPWTSISSGQAVMPGKTAPIEVSSAFDDDCEALLLKAIKGGHKEIKVAIYTFARKSIADALIERAKMGVKVSVKMDDKEAEFNYTEKLIEEMQKAKIKVERIKMKERGKMHHKFAVIDGATVVTGSFNWTKQAGEGNWENLIVIESPSVAAAYTSEWDRIDNSR